MNSPSPEGRHTLLLGQPEGTASVEHTSRPTAPGDFPACPSHAQALACLVQAHWDIRPIRLQPLRTGHTNTTYAVDAAEGPAILRVSWPGKPVAQVAREARLLKHLKRHPTLPVLPAARLTRHGKATLQINGRWLHLFDPVAGATVIAPGAAAMENALRALARLHLALQDLPTRQRSACAWLSDRLWRVSGRPRPPLPPELLEQYDSVLNIIGRHLRHTESVLPTAVQWLHGDYHAGNIRFVDDTVQGILDFDDPGVGSPLVETALALFAFSQDASRDDAFVFDAARWECGLQAYARQQRGAQEMLRIHRAALLPVFCADQVLIHLEAAQRGLWALGPGIGFLACWRTLLATAPMR